jgi:predicted metal-dependent peptidase
MQLSLRSDSHDRLLKARIGLAIRQPFLASALMRLPFYAINSVSWCPTMATDGYRIYFNPEWVSHLKDIEIRGVLAHELMHVIFSHSSRKASRDADKWNKACDYAINLFLLEQGFRLPAGGLVDGSFVGLPAEKIYDLIQSEKIGTKKMRGPSSVDSTEDGPGTLADAGSDLLDPSDPRLSGTKDASDPDNEQLVDLIEDLRSDATTKLQGNSSAWFKSECDSANGAKIDWRALLRSWLHDRIRNDWSLWPPSKKHIHRGLILPSVGVEAPGHLVFAVDTSGSMSDSELALIYAEVRNFRETFPCRLTILQADTNIKSIVEYGEMDGTEIPDRVSVHGRGGTDFRPVFDWMNNQYSGQGSALLFATDGYGTFPNHPPPFPVIWLKTPVAIEDSKFPFGSVVPLN